MAQSQEEMARILRARILLPPPEAAHLLAISQRKLWGLTARGDIPAVRIDRSVRYRLSTLLEYAERQEGK